jgi:hypothetical protein
MGLIVLLVVWSSYSVEVASITGLHTIIMVVA